LVRFGREDRPKMTNFIKKISPGPRTDPDSFAASVARASDGLIYISETDADIIPFTGEKVDEVTASAVAAQAGLPPEAPVEEVDAELFFERLTRPRDWHGERERERAVRFAGLRSVLKAHLKDLKVFRFGRIRIDIYVAGKSGDGCLAGVMTRAVET